jgi:hypothetical protein
MGKNTLKKCMGGSSIKVNKAWLATQKSGPQNYCIETFINSLFGPSKYHLIHATNSFSLNLQYKLFPLHPSS